MFVFFEQKRPVMTPETGGCVFFKLPLGHPADGTDPLKPFVSQPAGGAAVPGIVDHNGFVAVGGYPGHGALEFNGFNPVQKAFPRWPQLDLVNEPEKFRAFAVVSFGRFFVFGCHGAILKGFYVCG